MQPCCVPRPMLYTAQPMSVHAPKLQKDDIRSDAEQAGQIHAEKNEQIHKERVLQRLESFARTTLDEIGAAGIADIEKFRDDARRYVETKEHADDWERWLSSSERTGRELYAHLLHQLENAVMKGLIDEDGRKRWIARFRDPMATFKQKEYFVQNQMPKYIENWQTVADERRNIMQHPAFKLLTGSEIRDLATFKSDASFSKLGFDEKKNLVSMARAAVTTANAGSMKTYYYAKSMLEKAAGEGIMSRQKVGVWLSRIFASNADTAKIKSFVEGSSSTSLTALINNWRGARVSYDAVKAQLDAADHVPMGFTFVPLGVFLDMNYDQRISFLKEAKRTLTVSKDHRKEHPLLLEIRHALDIEDWDDAEDFIRKAERENFQRPEDISRLQSMRDYLRAHRKNDAGHTYAAQEEVASATQHADDVLNGLEPPVRAGAEEAIELGGLDGMRALRQMYYNPIWCHKNGYLNDEKTQKGYLENRNDSIERAKRGDDPGLHNAVETSKEILIRQNEHQKNSKVHATILHTELEEGSMRTVARWACKQDAYVKYWTSIVGHKGDKTMDMDWQMRQFIAFSELKDALSIIEKSGHRYKPHKGLIDKSTGMKAKDGAKKEESAQAPGTV